MQIATAIFASGSQLKGAQIRDAVLGEGRGEPLEIGQLAGRHGEVGGAAREVLPLGQRRDPPRDPVGAVDEAHAVAESLAQFGFEQGKVGAGENHRIEPLAILLQHQSRRGARDIVELTANVSYEALFPFYRFIGGSSIVNLSSKTYLKTQPYKQQQARQPVTGVCP